VLKQDAIVSHAKVEPQAVLSYSIAPGRAVWLQVATGSVEVDGQPLHAGDGLAIQQESGFKLRGVQTAELVLFDLA